MTNIEYPLLYFQLNEKAILGILVDMNMQVVERDLKTVKSNFTRYLQREYRKHQDYQYASIEDFKLQIIEVGVRPTYKNHNSTYPLSKTLKVPMPVVYGESSPNVYRCFLPLLNDSFHFYDTRQFKSLVRHIVRNRLNTKAPEEIYRYLSYPTPTLDSITLRVNTSRQRHWDLGEFQFQRRFRTLERLTEPYPSSKSGRKNSISFPEAAWELEDTVLDVHEKLIAQRANILIVGDRGVGKSAVFRQAIRKITARKQEQKLDFTFWRIMPQRITASAKYLGEWQETVEILIEELTSANGILWVETVIQLIQTGGEGPEDSVAAFMLSYLQQGKLQLIGEVTPQELESMRRLLPGFVENFQLVQLAELPEKKIQTILQRYAEHADRNLDVHISEDALSLLYRLLLRYYPYEAFPGKGVKFLGQCINEAKLNERTVVSKLHAIQNFVQQTGLPELFLRDDMLLNQQELTNFFNGKIIGQPKAVDKICGIVKVYKAGLNNPYKPISTLLFAGPTGVGKTASARALADYFFGKGQKQSPLVRIDMSEFQHPGQIGRFIGAGSEVGQLVKDVRERPFSVLLLDEVEKADPSIFDALMTVLDEGMMVDYFGRITNFRNSIIIMTTNLGASNRQSIGFKNTTSDEDNYLSAISQFFRPEFVNRIDSVVLFNPLTQNDIRQITLKELDDLRRREGFTKRNLQLHFSENLINHLANIGFDKRYGARPLQRAIEQTLVNPMAHWLLNHPKVEGQAMELDFAGELVVKVKR